MTKSFVFLHSSLQSSIYQCISPRLDEPTVFVHRSQSRPLEGADYVYRESILQDYAVTQHIQSCLQGANLVFVLPHSVDNYIFTIAALDSRVSLIHYIEDGWSTWESSLALTQYNLPTRTTHFTNALWLIFLRILYGLMFIPFFPPAYKQRLFKYLHKSLLNNVTKRFWISDIKLGKSFVSYSPLCSFEEQVDITPRRFQPSDEYTGSVALFLNPRYLTIGCNEFFYGIRKLIHSQALLLVLHPKFYKSSHRKSLEKFFDSLSKGNQEFSIYQPLASRYDVSFDLFMRGCRHFLCCGTTIQLTAATYKDFFRGLTIDSFSTLVDGEPSFLDQRLGYSPSGRVVY